MILAADVAYSGTTATAAGVLFSHWNSETPDRTFIAKIDDAAEYVSGEFYRRELPCIVKLLEQVDLPLECIVIDGYVTLGAAESAGLGWKLWEFLGRTTPVIGVAKSEFHGTPEKARLYRGDSTKPLFVTAAGTSLEYARSCVVKMSGKHRVPALLKAADHLSRRGQRSA